MHQSSKPFTLFFVVRPYIKYIKNVWENPYGNVFLKLMLPLYIHSRAFEKHISDVS